MVDIQPNLIDPSSAWNAHKSMMAFRQFECIYADMTRFDLAAAMAHVQAFGRRETTRLRLNVHKTGEPAALTK